MISELEPKMQQSPTSSTRPGARIRLRIIERLAVSGSACCGKPSPRKETWSSAGLRAGHLSFSVVSPVSSLIYFMTQYANYFLSK